MQTTQPSQPATTTTTKPPKPVEPASYALMGTRVLTLGIAGVMLRLSFEGEQEPAKLALSGVAVGTLLLTPDIGSAVLALRPKSWLSEKLRKWLTTIYVLLLVAFAGTGVLTIIIGIVTRALTGPFSLALVIAYEIVLLMLVAVVAVGTLPLWLPGWLRSIVDHLPESRRKSIKKLSDRARVGLAHVETKALPAGIGAVLFVAGTTMQFVLLVTTHATVPVR